MTIEAYRNMQQCMTDGYEAEDLAGRYQKTSSEYKKLPRLHKAVWAFFGSVKNKGDMEHVLPSADAPLRNGRERRELRHPRKTA